MQDFKRITESDSTHHDLEKKSSLEIIQLMNQEDRTVAEAVSMILPAIATLVDVIVSKLAEGGRLFYIGAGTSGRLGILDASECPPTFGVPHDLVIGLIAGGDTAIRRAVEGAEDSETLAWENLRELQVDARDVVIGIAASGTTPYVVHGLAACSAAGITTACITCNPGSPVSQHSDYALTCVVGPEIVSGSTRLKSGTAQKMILNMISTATMIRLGHVIDNKMVDMTLSNQKLMDRGIRLLMSRFGINNEQARQLLLNYKSVRAAMDYMQQKTT